MTHDLIQSDVLSSEFLALMGVHTQTPSRSSRLNSSKGQIQLSDLDEKLQTFVKSHIKNSVLIGDGFSELFEGCLNRFQDDHSKADFALIQIVANAGFNPEQCDQVLRASGLYREKWDSNRNDSTYGWQTIDSVFNSLSTPTDKSALDRVDLNLADFVPRYVPGGMPAREFVGPKIATGAHLFPKNAISAMVALGGGAKTSSVISIAAHVAAGRHWKGSSIKSAKVILFAVEETQDELNRKYSAVVDPWPESERNAASENLRLVSLMGVDARLIHREFGEVSGTAWAKRIADLSLEFGICDDGLIILDHFQGFTSGDMNTSDTATSMCREANKIVSQTKAAVVFTAHIPKSQIGTFQITQGMASGSLAFENAMRQVVVLIPMSDEEAKKYDLVDDKGSFVKLGFAKNSYGATNTECWLRKVYVPDYHTIRIDPVDLLVPVPQARRSANDKLADTVIRFIQNRSYVSKNMVDRESGRDGQLGASKDKCRDVLKGLIDSGAIHSHRVTDDERIKLGIPKQVTEVLRVS